MSTGGSIFYTVLLLLVLAIFLGILLYYAMDTREAVDVAQQAEQACRQDYAQSSAELEAARTENNRLMGLNQTLEGQLAQLNQAYETERLGRLRAEAEAASLQQRSQALEQQSTDQRVVSEITATQIQTLVEQLELTNQALSSAQAQNQILQEQLQALEKASTILELLGNWLDWSAQGKVILGLATGGLATSSLATGAAVLYSKRRRGWKVGRLKASLPAPGPARR